MTDLRLTIQKKPYCLANSRTVRGTLMDFGFEKRIVQVMVNLYDCGIVEKVRLCGGVLSQTEIYNLTVTQENNYGTSSKYIEEGIQKWAEALGVTVGQSSVPWPEPKPEPQKEPRSETAATTSVLQGFCGTNCDRQHREHGDGQNAVWSYDGKGTLTISGKGYLADYYDYSIADRPWHEFKDQITNLVVTGEIKSIGFRAFRGCSRLKSVTLPDGLRGIPAYVFEECRALEYISLPNSVEGIGDAAFHNCISLHTVVLPQICFAENAFDPGVILSRSNIALPEREGSCGPNARWKFDGRGN